MRILRWMCELTRRDKVRNEIVREKVGITVVEDKIREVRLRWFFHVMRRDTDTLVWRCEILDMDGLRRFALLMTQTAPLTLPSHTSPLLSLPGSPWSSPRAHPLNRVLYHTDLAQN